MVIKNFSSRSAQACSSRAFMPTDCTPGPSGSQHLLNVVVLARYSHRRGGGFKVGGHVYDLSKDDLMLICADFEKVRADCSKISLVVSARNAEYISTTSASALDQGTRLDNVWIVNQIDNFQRTLMFDMEQDLFFHVPRDKKHYYEQ